MRSLADNLPGLFFLHHRRGFGDGARPLHREMAQYGVIEFESVLEFIKHRLITLDVHQNVVCFVNFLNWIDQLPSAPVFYAMDLTVPTGDKVPVTFDHC